ncbi:probable phosphoinositide phosphatase SAC9 [Gossypium arboreum]|uniref:probable phosphoinositide phosphatase SAC9 n=1 Tax=Gossypium arboreum TaxID=29729 RepID=UPI0008191ED2|nr:probable phosphoinositide phosphatase SAC9 [Gossypium arboreum]
MIYFTFLAVKLLLRLDAEDAAWLAESRSFGSSGQVEGIVALTACRSGLHPGTRYLARGINSCFSTGGGSRCKSCLNH